MALPLKITLHAAWLVCLVLLLVLTRNEFSWMLEEDPGATLPEDPRESFKVGLALAALVVALLCQLWLGFTASGWAGRLIALALGASAIAAWARFQYGG